MSKHDTIDEIENYLDSLGIHSSKISSTYAGIGFDPSQIDTTDQRDVIQDLIKIAPLNEFTHQWNKLYEIIFLDDTVFPIKINQTILDIHNENNT